MISQDQVIRIRTSLNKTTDEMANLFGVESKEWAAWEAGEKSPEYTKVVKIFFTLLASGKMFISSSSKHEMSQTLTKAKHLNDKLAEQALGADATMHQYINDEISTVIKELK